MKRSLLFAVGLLIAFPLTVAAQRTKSAKKYVKQRIERFSRTDIVGAIAEYDRALGIDPQNADAYLNRGKARGAAGDLDGAIDAHEVAVNLAPDSALSKH